MLVTVTSSEEYMEENPNRDFRMQGYVCNKQGYHSDFYLQNVAADLRVHGLMLFGTDMSTRITSLQFSNEQLIVNDIPGYVFDNPDVITMAEAQKLLEEKKLPLLKRQAMQGVIMMGCTSRMMVTGPCEGAAIYTEMIPFGHGPYTTVTVLQRGDMWMGTIEKDTIRGMVKTLDIEAPTEDAIMQAIVAGLGGVRVRVG